MKTDWDINASGNILQRGVTQAGREVKPLLLPVRLRVLQKICRHKSRAGRSTVIWAMLLKYTIPNLYSGTILQTEKSAKLFVMSTSKTVREISMSIFNKTGKENSSSSVIETPATAELPKMSMGQKSGGNNMKEISSIGMGLFVTGRFDIKTDKHELHIDGTLQGEIYSKSSVKIGQDAKVKGDIIASKLIISGEFIGNADCDSIELIEGGSVEGTLTASTLTIDATSSFQGQSNRKGQERADARGHTQIQEKTPPQSVSGNKEANPSNPAVPPFAKSGTSSAKPK